MENKMLLIGVCIPSSHEWEADFALSLINMQRALIANPNIKGYSGVGIKIFNRRGSNLSALRQGLVEEAIAQKCTHVLFLDSDMYFPAMLIHMLARHKRKIVACNCPTKAIPASPTARLKDGTAIGKVLYTTEHTKQLVEVWRVGTGVLMIDVRAFEGVPKPWFDFTYKGEEAQSGRDWEGEDWYLCKLLQEAGHKIYVDQEASWLIGHIGTFIYSHAEVEVPEEKPKIQLIGSKK